MSKKIGRPTEFDEPLETKIIIRVPADYKESFEEIVKTNSTSVSRVIRTMMKNYIDGWEATNVEE